MPVPILPQIAPDHPLNFTSSGKWTAYAASDFLDKLINSLAQGTSLEDAQSIDSVPHVWAKPLLFKMALFDNDEDFVVGLKEHVTGEWRALLAMLALKDELHLNLTAFQINLTVDNSPQARVFKDLAPTEALDGNGAAWMTDTYILSFNGAPIAMTSPVTLVATAADYSDNLLQPLTAPWSNNGLFLTDPIPYLSNHALNALKVWLVDLQSNLVAMAGVNGAKTNLITALLTCVSNYIADVTARITTPAKAGDFSLKVSSLKFGSLLGGLLQNAVQSTVVAPSVVELVSVNQNLLLVSPQMLQELAAQLRVPIAHIAVYGGLTANKITEVSLQQGHNQIGAVILAGIEWRSPEEFFQEQMVLLPSTNVFCNLFNSDKTTDKTAVSNKFTAVLPIKPELAEIFSTSEELLKRINIEYADGNGMATAKLTFDFTLKGIGGKEVTYTFQKTYSQADNTLIKVAKTEIPVLEIWPDFICVGWKNYYMHYSNSRSESTEAKYPATNLCFFAPWSSEAHFSADMPPDEFADIFTANMNDFPEALTCTYVSANGTPIKAGMIFLKKPATINPRAALAWNVGIDFGTSATMIFFAANNSAPQPLNLKPHLYQVTNSDESTRPARTTLNFISNNDEFIRDGSFLSVFHLLNHQINGTQNIQPLQDGHVLLLNSNSPYHKDPQYSAFIDTNIKWDQTNKLEAYVQQICMQIFVEALSAQVGNVSWNFSYPLAFTVFQHTNFIVTCQSAVNMLKTGQSVKDLPESEALAYYFYNLNHGHLNHSICIDIGAGTTDISVISGAPSRIVFHTSVQYAGRHIFNSIYENFGLFTGTKEKFVNPLTDKATQAAIDLAMRDNSDEYIQNLRRVLADNATNVQAICALKLAFLAVAGLFYYLGKILKALRAANFYTGDTLPQVFVGGNGSRIFNWLTQGLGLKQGSPYTAVLEEILSDAADWETTNLGGFSLKLSTTPKVEVASGMISPTPMAFYNKIEITKAFSAKFGDRYTQTAVIAGAKFSGDSAHTAEELLNETDIQRGIKTDATLGEFKKFISTFNKACRLYDLSDNRIAEDEKFDAVIDEVRSATCGFYDNQIGQPDTAKISVEPIFIVELKEFIKNAGRLS